MFFQVDVQLQILLFSQGLEILMHPGEARFQPFHLFPEFLVDLPDIPSFAGLDRPGYCFWFPPVMLGCGGLDPLRVMPPDRLDPGQGFLRRRVELFDRRNPMIAEQFPAGSAYMFQLSEITWSHTPPP